MSDNMNNEMNEITNDKIKGMILGAVYGDVLGSPHEFSRTAPKIEEIIIKPVKKFNRYTKNYAIGIEGQYTDDTQMAIILLNRLMTDGMYDKNRVLLDYIEWANSGCKFMGRNTKALFKGVTTINGYLKRYDTRFPNEHEKSMALSNGSLMRCYPIAYYGLTHNNYLNVINADCLLTNPSNDVINGEQMYVTSLIKTLQGKTKEEIIGDYKIVRAFKL